MIKRILSAFLITTLLVSCMHLAVMAEETTVFNETFENYDASSDGTVAPIGFSGSGASAYTSDDKPFSGFFSTLGKDGGKALMMRTNRKKWLELIRGLGTPATTVLDISIDINLPDYNATKMLMVRGSNAAGADQYERAMVSFNKTDGKLLFDGKDTGFNLETDTWYSVHFVYNIQTKLCLGELYSAEGELLVQKYFLTTYGANKIGSIYFDFSQNTITEGVIAAAKLDNYCVKLLDNFAYPIDYSFDFDSFNFSDDGQTVPEGITLEGGVPGVCGIWSEEETQSAKLATGAESTVGISVGFPMELVGTYSICSDILLPADFSGNLSFGFTKDAPLLSIDGETMEAVTGSEKLLTVEADKWYNIQVIFDSLSKTANVTVKDTEGNAFSSDIPLPDGISTFKKVGMYLESNDEATHVFADNVKVCAVHPFACQKITPTDSSGRILADGELCFVFSNDIASWGDVTIDGELVDEDAISVVDGKNLCVISDGLIDFDGVYTVSIGEITDIFGNTIEFIKEIKTAPRVEYSEISLEKIDENAVAENTVTVYDDEVYSVNLVLAVYNKDGEMVSHKTATEYVTKGTCKLSCSLPLGDDDFARAYLWDDFESIDVINKSKTLGTVGLGETESSMEKCGFLVDRDSAIVTVGGIGIGEGTAALVVLNPEFNKDTLISNPEEAIAYIWEYGDEYTKNGHSFTLPGKNGEFDVLYRDGKTGETQYIEKAFCVYTKEVISEVIGQLNESSPNLDGVFSENANIIDIDNTEYLELTQTEKSDLHNAFLAKRDELGGAFESVSQIRDAYYKALALSIANNSDNGESFETVFAKYEKELEVDKSTVYKTYKTLSEKGIEYLFEKLVSADEYDDFEELTEAFEEFTVLGAIYSVENSVDITNILNDNKNVHKIDMDKYNSLKNPYDVNAKLDGKEYSSMTEFKKKFDEAVSEQYKKENSKPSNDSSSSSKGSGGGVSFAPVVPQITPQPSLPENKFCFSDMANTQWAEEAVYSLYEKGIVSGKNADSFAPNDKITREEFAKLLVCAFYADAKDSKCSFSDVPESAWYYEYVSKAYGLGIVNGKSDSVFGSGEYITRQDLAVMSARAAKISEDTENAFFADENLISDYAKGYVNAMCKNGIVKGKTDSLFAPGDNATRAEAAVIVYRLLTYRGE